MKVAAGQKVPDVADMIKQLSEEMAKMKKIMEWSLQSFYQTAHSNRFNLYKSHFASALLKAVKSHWGKSLMYMLHRFLDGMATQALWDLASQVCLPFKRGVEVKCQQNTMMLLSAPSDSAGANPEG